MQQSRQAQEVELFLNYQQAISCLEQDKSEEGKTLLKNLLQNPIIHSNESKGILYGTYISLAEILGSSEQILDQCEALAFYHESNHIIQNCWQTYHKMAILFRQLGLIPRAINLTIKALQNCKIVSLHSQLLYEACCESFIINEKEQFFKYFKNIQSKDPFKIMLLEIEKYYKQQIKSPFIDKLLEEQQNIPEKLKQIPIQLINQEFFQQQYDCQLKIDVLNLGKFFKKIKVIFKSSLSIDYDKLECQLQDQSIFIKTSITIKEKDPNKPKQINGNDYSKDNKLHLKINQQNESSLMNKQKKINLEKLILSKFTQLIEYIDNIKTIESFSLINQSSNKYGGKMQIEEEEMKNEQDQANMKIGKFLLSKLKGQKFLTVLSLFSMLLQILMKEYQTKTKIEETQLQLIKYEIIKAAIWAQFSMKQFHEDPRVQLEILNCCHNYLAERVKNNKLLTPKQHLKIKLSQQMLQVIKNQLLFFTDSIKQIPDEKEESIYKKKFYKIMQELHCENIIINGDINQLQQEQDKTKQLIVEKEKKQVNLTLNSIIGEWEQFPINFNNLDILKNQIQVLYIYFQDNCQVIKSMSTIKQILKIMVSQFYNATHFQQLVNLEKLMKPVLEQIQLFPTNDSMIALYSIKIGMITNIVNADSSKYIAKFFKIYMPQLKFPKKQLIMIESLKVLTFENCLPYSILDINFFLQEFINLRIKMKEIIASLLKYFTQNGEKDEAFSYYIFSLIEKKIGLYPEYEILPNQVKLEIQKNTINKIPPPPIYSSESEDEYQQIQLFSKNYKPFKLSIERIQNPYKLGDVQCQFQQDQVEFLLGNQISVNLSDPKILKQIRKFSKEIMKKEIGLTTKKLKDIIYNYIFKQYYFIKDYQKIEYNEQDITFFGLFLPLLLQNQLKEPTLNKFIESMLLTQLLPKLSQKIEQPIQVYCEQLYMHLFTKQPLSQHSQQQQQSKQQLNKIKELKEEIEKNNLKSIYKSNLFYLIQNQLETKTDFRYICLAIAYNDNPFLWNKFYLMIFNLALLQLNQKVIPDIDWFISQKKIQVMLNKQPEMEHLFEYRFIMDLLKAQQRQIDYQNNNNDQTYQKTQSAYQVLLQQNQLQIPKNLSELKYNFRVLLLIEKKILRKLRNLDISRIYQNIDNLSQLQGLILEMKHSQLTYYFNSNDGEIEIVQDLYINIYKFIRRFIRNKLNYSLSIFLQYLMKKLPQLFKQISKEPINYIFQRDQKVYKIIHISQQQLQYEESYPFPNDQIVQVLNNLYMWFSQVSLKFTQQRNQRYIIEAIYYSSHLMYYSTKATEKVHLIYQQLSILYQPQQRDIINYHKIIEGQYSEKDEVLRQYYNHDLIFFYLKTKIIKLLIKIMILSQRWKELMDLIEKLQFYSDLRLQQACIELINNYDQIDSIDIMKEAITKLSYIIKNQLKLSYLADNQNYYQMYLKLHDLINDDIYVNSDVKYKRAKAIIEEYKKQIKVHSAQGSKINISQQNLDQPLKTDYDNRKKVHL